MSDVISLAQYITPDCHHYTIDRNNRITNCNEQQAKTLKLSRKEVIGAHIGDLVAETEATICISNNEEVMRHGKGLLLWEICQSDNGQIHACISHKIPLYDQRGKIIGLKGISIILTPEFFPISTLLIAPSDEVMFNKILNTVNRQNKLNKKASYYNEKNGKFYLGKRFNYQCLTRVEYAVFKLVALGKTSNEIANCLAYSVRTVEDYIVKIKNKLGCSRKHQLIQIGITYGLLSNEIPSL